MALYRLCLIGANGRIAAVQRLRADTDKEALSIARETVKGHAKVSGFALWTGPRRVDGMRTARGESRRSARVRR